MIKMRHKYNEGDVFSVPLRNSGFAIGVLARKPKRGKVLLGYFYGYFFKDIPSPQNIPDLKPENAIKVVLFGALSLWNGEWQIISHLSDWNRDEWPVPKFVRHNPISKTASLITYSDTDLASEIKEEKCDFDITGYEVDSLEGAGFVEITLTKLLSPRSSD